jgi:hypothetical protein
VKHRTRASFPLLFSIVLVCAGLLLAGTLAAQTNPAQANKEPPPPPPKHHASAILIQPVDPGDLPIPAEFRVALYEYLVEQVAKTKKFEHVYRSGNKDAAGTPDLVTLRTKAESFKKGSEKQREVTTVSGFSSIKLKLLITDHDGKVLADPDVTGSVRFFGGNLNATYDFAKKTAEVINTLF